MGTFEVYLGDGNISLHHIERRVAEQPFQFQGVSTVPQEIDGERVAEAVDVGIVDPGTLPQPLDDPE